MTSFRHRLSSAHVIALLALFIALGGTSYAVVKLPKNSVGSEQVRDGTLRANDLSSSVLQAGPRGPRGTEGPTGAKGDTGAQGPIGPSAVKVAFKDATTLNTAANAPTLIAHIDNLPAGSYLLTFNGEATLRTPAPPAPQFSTYVVCQIRINGTVISSGVGTIGDGLGGNENFADSFAVQRSAPFDLSEACHTTDSTATSGGTPYVYHAKLTALTVGSASVDTQG